MIKKFLLGALLSLAAAPALAQLPGGDSLVINQSPVVGGTTSQCLYITSTRTLGSQACGGAPSGAAGGVLSGTYPNPGFAPSPVFSTQLTVPRVEAPATLVLNVPTGNQVQLAVNNTVIAGVINTGFYPAADNTFALGGASTRWSDVQAARATISSNAAALQAPVTGTVLQLGQLDATVNTVTHDGYNAANVYAFRRAGGTAASPSGLPSGSAIGIVSAYGRGATGYSAAGRATLNFVSAETGTWTDSAQGALVTFQTTPVGTTTTGESFRIASNGLSTPYHYRSTAPNTRTTATYSVLDTDNYIIANVAGTLTLTLPAASTYTGRALYVKTITANTVVSNASNVVPRAGGAAGTAILAAAAGNWAMLVSNGTAWENMAGTP